MPEWIFDVLPPSGARRGGDPAEHAFKHDLDTFVREVVQNANDQRLGTGKPEVHFRLHELSGVALEGFLAKLSWNTLEPHLRAVSNTRGGRSVARFLSELDRTNRASLLTIEDRHTVGLTGDESEEDTHFRALCKDTLYSHKRHAAAGGSFGLGKSVLWAFSGISTVLFNSVLHEHPKGRRSPRLIGRAELSSHKIDGEWFGGSGWFGTRAAAPGGARAESLWSLEASLEARDLFLQREERSTGTSIALIGFRDPTLDEEATSASTHDKIRAAATKWFWPAMEMASPGLCITADGVASDPESDPLVRPFVECWRGRTSRRSALEQPGDVVTRAIPVELPPPRDGSRATRGEVLLIVRLAPENVRHSLAGHIAMFRGPGMVVKYWDRSSLALGMRPFHAIVAAGEARDPAATNEADREVERFLRDAEPPGHDEWHSTPALKESWKRGYLKAIEQLKDRIGHALRDLLTPKPSHGSRGPELLQRRFPIGRRGRSTAEPSAFRFADLDASFDGERWSFSGSVAPLQRSDGEWEASVSLREIGDDGARLDEIAVEAIETVTTGARADVEEGIARIVATPDTKTVSFRGRSRRVLGDPAELLLEVGGRRAPETP